MSSWLRTWLPALPSIELSLPTSIQRRFLSFALRQALGHLLKPGQLDTQQVDAQIGSGFVQVRDVELENEAINSLITGLPLRLHDGSLGKVTARIPWPNPLTATIGLSLESLHLTFLILPETSREIPVHSSLAESVTSVAETFIHDELDPDEEASLRDSFHPDLDASEPALNNVPGGLDPFMNDEGLHNEADPSGVSVFASLLERLLSRFHFDATDTKITFVHPEHASFTVTIPAIRYQTDVVNDIASSDSSAAEGKELRGGRASGTTRSVSISGVSVTTRCLRPQSPQHISSVETPKSPTSTTLPTVYRSPPSPTFSDSSELDEETHMIMSQSIAGLPPRPGSPASSVASSMYQSAISIAPTGPSPPMPTYSPEILEQGKQSQVTPSTTQAASTKITRPELGVVTDEIQDETILSFGTEPVTIRLSTPPPVRQSTTTSSLKTPPSDHEIHEPSGALRLEVSLGTVAVALKARHIRSFLDVSQLWASHIPSHKVEESADDVTPRSLFDCLDADLRIRGFVLLLLPSHSFTRANDPNDPVVDFFNHPLVSPRLLHGYMRTHLDSINASMSIRSTSESATSRTATPKSVNSTITASLTLADISAFAFLALTDRDTENMELRASPILITDPNLPCQYSTMHERPDLRSTNSTASLPSFDIIDWTDPAHQTSSPRPSQWRAHVPQNSKLSGQGIAQASTSPRRGSAGTSHSPRTNKLQAGPSTHSAVNAKFTMITRRRDGRTSRNKGKAPTSSIQLQVDIAPLHVFADLSLVFGSEASVAGTEVLAFLQELSFTDTSNDPQTQEDEGEGEDEFEDDDTPPATPRASSSYMTRKSERDEERERKRLERMVLEDLDLGYDYRQDAPAPSSRTPGSQFHDWPKASRAITLSCTC
ncbi:hypothetical protein EIP86_004058 [Pleurotus ostreatoroseus]|nr:hypothetical protein EIP86_004058 [Pleurotus ostreatoroseus]